jgi:hypothetical protein
MLACRASWHPGCDDASLVDKRIDAPRLIRKELQLLVVRAMAGERVSFLLGGRRYTLTVDPLYRIADESDGFLFLCLGLTSLQTKLEQLADSSLGVSGEKISKLGGAQESH